MLDLTQFCSPQRVAERQYLDVPFSWGDWTYATNGHIIVRVARRPDVPETHAAYGDDIERVWFHLMRGKRILVPMPKFDPPPVVTCEICKGRGFIQRCSACRGQNALACDDACDDGYVPALVAGTGEVCYRCENRTYYGHHVRIRFKHIDLGARYAMLMASLPGVRVDLSGGAGEPVPFVFQGGSGAVMPPPVEYEREPAVISAVPVC